MASLQIASTLERLNSRALDKDEKFMALSDLRTELSRDTVKMDREMEVRVCAAVVSQIVSTSVDIRELGLECLPKLVALCEIDIINKLCKECASHMLSPASDPEITSVACRSLIIVVKEMAAPELAKSVVETVTPTMLDALKGGSISSDITNFCLDVLEALYRLHGSAMEGVYQRSLEILIPIIDTPNRAISRTVIACLAALAQCLPRELLDSLLIKLTENFGAFVSSKNDSAISCVFKTISNISRSAGPRLAPYLDSLVRLMLEFVTSKELEEKCDLREQCFATLENLLRNCGNEIVPHTPGIVGGIKECIGYDPNFVGDVEHKSTEAMDERGDDEESDDGFGGPSDDDFGGTSDDDSDADAGHDSEDDFDDDEDESWKVRRSACKCVLGILFAFQHAKQGKHKNVYRSVTNAVYKELAPILIKRFQERQDNIAVDVYESFKEIVTQTQLNKKDPVKRLGCSVSDILNELSHVFGHKSVAVRTSTFELLQEIITHLSIPEEQSKVITKAVLAEIKTPDGDAAELSIALKCLALLMHNATSKSTFSDVIEEISENVLNCVTTTHKSQISVEAFRVLEEVIEHTYAKGSTTEVDSTLDAVAMEVDSSSLSPPSTFSDRIFNACIHKLDVHNTEQTVSNAALNCIGRLCDYCWPGDKCWQSLEILSKYLDLEHETTRIAAVQTVGKIYEASLKSSAPKTHVPDKFVQQIPSFLRQSSDSLKESAVSSLDVIFGMEPSSFQQKETSERIIRDVCNLLRAQIANDKLTLQILKLVETLISADNSRDICLAIEKEVLPSILTLMQTTALEPVMRGVVSVFSAVPSLKCNGQLFPLDFEAIIGWLRNVFQTPSDNEHLLHLQRSCSSQCVAGLILNSSDHAGFQDKYVNALVDSLSSTNDQDLLFYLSVLGEIGKLRDLASDKVTTRLTQLFDSPSDQISTASAIALGNIVSGNVSLLSALMSRLQTDLPKCFVLDLKALKQFLDTKTKDLNTELIQTINSSLYRFCEAKEEEHRGIASACLGTICTLHPECIQEISAKLNSSTSARGASSLLSALNEYVTQSSHSNLANPAINGRIAMVLSAAISHMEDADVNIVPVTIRLIKNCALHYPTVFMKHYAAICNSLFEHTRKKAEYVKSVDFGPITKDVDEGIPIREASFDCLLAIVQASDPDSPEAHIRFDGGEIEEKVSPFIECICRGITDEHQDVAFLANQLLWSLIDAGYLSVAAVEPLVDPLRSVVNKKLRENAMTQEVEEHRDALKTALKSINYLQSGVLRIKHCEVFWQFYQHVLQNHAKNGVFPASGEDEEEKHV